MARGAAFDRTYEGLKPGTAGHLGTDTPPAFDRTYEGLKRHVPPGIGQRPEPFDRTYEGLKPYTSHIVDGNPPKLLTVPMRV